VTTNTQLAETRDEERFSRHRPCKSAVACAVGDDRLQAVDLDEPIQATARIVEQAVLPTPGPVRFGGVDIARPTSLEEATVCLDRWPDATILAGGTDLMVEVNLAGRRPERIVSLRRVGELDVVDGRRIGAGVTFQALERSPHAALAQLARTVGSPQIRAAGTIGGNLGTASPAGDSLPFLAALDADIEVASSAGTRVVPFADFMTGVKQTSLRRGELITAAILPAHVPSRQAFAKVGVRSSMVISIVSGCVLRRDDGGTRIAMGAVGPTMIRPRAAEQMISAERNPTAAACDEFSRLVAQAVTPITDHRATAEYRRHATAVLARRLLERVL